eukprot:gene13183-13314_t
MRAAKQLVFYEGAPEPILVKQDEEPDDLLAALCPNSAGHADGQVAQILPGLLPAEQSCRSPDGGRTAACHATGMDDEMLPGSPTRTGARMPLQPRLWGGLRGMVGLCEEYNSDYELLQRALCRSAGGSDAGRVNPSGTKAGLGVDDLVAGNGYGSAARSESPASVEGRNRKYRRSDS